jgi:hypothetical protein
MGMPDDEGGTAGGRVLQRMLAGGMAGMTSTSLLFPLDNLTTRLATSGRPREKMPATSFTTGYQSAKVTSEV